MIKLSLVVPTYNRSHYLEKALLSFLEQDLDPALYEILVIDNNSTDDTEATVRRVMRDAPCSWNYLLEPTPGAHMARNKGILAAQGEIVVLGDEDIVASPSWLTAILEEFDHHPDTGVVGGKTLPIWNEPPEDWIYDYGTAEIHPVFSYLDYGEERLVLEDEYVYSNNMAMLRWIAVRTGGCFPDAYPGKLKHLTGTGEYAMIDNTRNLEYDAVYLPDMLVCHHADASRASLEYFIDRYERWAVEAVFDAFRKMSKREAAQQLILAAADRLIELETESHDKINPNYYRIIQKHWAYQTIKQTCRVLTEPALYDHIVQESYF